jgi:putative ABC transport system permease protein
MGKTLLFVQFVISTICICATVIIGKQISFVKETDLGYDRSHVVSLVMPDEYPADRVALLKNAFVNQAGVESVSYSYYLMPISTYFKGWYEVEHDGKMEKILLNEMFVDHDYFETMGIRLVVGRNFDIGNPADKKTGFIINETAAKELGWINPIGKRMKVGYSESSEQDGAVIGVVKDFNSLSLHKKIEPVVLRLQYDNWPGNSLNVKVKGSLSEMLPMIVSTYEKLMPGYLADARVVEDLHKRQYQDEDKAFSSLQIGTIVIMVISAIGIFSLSFYTSIKRFKEFGIRKVLGASVWQIASLQINDFVKVVFVANVFALPISYWLMNEWLDGFAYRTELNVFVFIGVMGISLVLVIVSGGYSALKAGSMNPVDVIKIQ